MKKVQNTKYKVRFAITVVIFLSSFSFEFGTWNLGLGTCSAQNAGINATGNPPNAKALLDLDATGISPKTGLLIPRMTTAERNAITAPIPESLLIYNTTTKCFEWWDVISSTWISMSCNCQLPGSFTATAATNIAQTAFDANWTASSGATTYFLDVATDATFTAFVTGYNNLNVGNVTTYSVNTNLACATTYYYRVRAENSCGISANSNTITAITSSCCSPGDVDNGDGTCTATFYPDANPETTSVDGGASRVIGSCEVWSIFRSGAGTNFDDSSAKLIGYTPYVNGTIRIMGFSGCANKWYSLVRSIVLFDTSTLPDGASISAATLSLYGFNKWDGIGPGITPDINIYSSNPASNTALVASDFNIANFGSVAFSTAITYAGWSITGYNDFALNASGINAISLVGISKFGIRNANYDVANVAPANPTADQSSGITAYASEQGAGYKPKLVVTYTP